MFDPETKKALANVSGSFLKGTDFEEGQVLQFLSVEKIKSQYGAEADHKMVEKGVLEEGQSFRFHFVTKDGSSKTFDTTSFPFVIGMNNAEISDGDWVKIVREGKGDKTRYTAEKTEAPVGSEDSPFN